MEHPKLVGDRTTLAVMLALQAAGLDLLLPFGENVRYDLAVDDGEQIRRVQCKTGRLRRGAVIFATCSNYAHHRAAASARRDYGGEIDAFGVYCSETRGVYLVPIEAVPAKAEAALRVEPARNGQVSGIRLAAAFLIGEIELTPSLGAVSAHAA